MFRSVLYSVLLAVLPHLGAAGTVPATHCGHRYLLQHTAGKAPEALEAFRRIAGEAADRQLLRRSDSMEYTIQVVFHILYNPDDPYQYIADELVHSQLEALNRDFNRKNADTVNTREAFRHLGAAANIRFVLAADGNGDCRNAIIRKTWSAPPFFVPILQDFLVKDAFWGGSTAWNTDEYLNIWIADLNRGNQPEDSYLGGYAYLPALAASGLPERYDGIVVDFRFFGQDNPYILEVAPGFSTKHLGRTTVHEVGHWLGLQHTWGELGTLLPEQGCLADDGIYDTPNEQQPYSAYGGCRDTLVNSCYEGPGDLPDMYENYMNYSRDDCYTMFTAGQVAVNRYVLSDFRSGLQHPYRPGGSRATAASVTAGDSIDLCYDVNPCFPPGQLKAFFCDNGDSAASSGAVSARLLPGSDCIRFTTPDTDSIYTVAFCLVTHDQEQQLYDTLFIDLSVNGLVVAVPPNTATPRPSRVYPNPSGGTFRLEIFGRDADRLITVHDLTGRVLWRQMVEAGESRPVIRLPEVAQGWYQVRISGPGSIESLPLLISR